MSEKEALEKIKELCKPGQQLNIRDAIELICECYNIAKEATKGN